MFEKRKIKWYADSIIGFAYERIDFRNINTYLVVKNRCYNYIKFVLYRKYKNLCDENMTELINILESQGYKILNYYIEEKENIKKLKKVK